MKGHIRQRSPGTFELRYRAGGKTVTATFRGGKRDAERELRRLMSLVDNNLHPNDPDRLTVAAWLLRWLDMIKSEIEPRSLERYEAIVRLRIIPAFGDVLLTKSRPVEVQDYYTKLAKKGLAPRTRRQSALVLVNALNRATKLQLIAISPAAAIDLPSAKQPPRKMVTLGLKEATALIETARPTTLHLPVLLALAIGMRRGEILAASWASIDFATGTISVDFSLEQIGRAIRSKSPKSGKPRKITLPSPVVAELRRLKAEQAEALLRLGIRQTDATPICMRADGTVSSPRALSQLFSTFIRRSGLPVLRYHDLRHTHATQLLSLGTPLKAVSERLGHSDPAFTLRTYAHSMPTDDAQAAALISTIFKL
jgi:integrase